jgi:putative membrane protein
VGDKSVSANAAADPNARTDYQPDRNDGKLSRGDANFIREAAKGGHMEVQIGQTARDRASNADVKSFGERLVKDHSEVNEKLAQLASQKGVNLAKDVDKNTAHDHGKIVMELEQKSGADFDREFIKHALKDHKKDISKFEKASRDSEDSDVRSFAINTLPKLREHQLEAERLARFLGIEVNVSEASNAELNARAEASGAPGVLVENRDTLDTDKNDGKTLGVETKKGDNKILGIETRPGDGKTLGLNTSKDDGKLLGVIPAPGGNKAENRVDVDVDRDDHIVEVDPSVGAPAGSEKGASIQVDANAGSDAKVMAYSDVPAKVQTTIKNEGGNDRGVKVKKHTINNRTAYRVEFERDGRNRVLQVAEDGTIIKDNKAK